MYADRKHDMKTNDIWGWMMAWIQLACLQPCLSIEVLQEIPTVAELQNIGNKHTRLRHQSWHRMLLYIIEVERVPDLFLWQFSWCAACISLVIYLRTLHNLLSHKQTPCSFDKFTATKFEEKSDQFASLHKFPSSCTGWQIARALPQYLLNVRFMA